MTNSVSQVREEKNTNDSGNLFLVEFKKEILQRIFVLLDQWKIVKWGFSYWYVLNVLIF